MKSKSMDCERSNNRDGRLREKIIQENIDVELRRIEKKKDEMNVDRYQ